MERLTEMMQAQIMRERLQRSVVQMHIDRSICADQQETSRFTPPRKRRHEIEGGAIAPVQIF